MTKLLYVVTLCFFGSFALAESARDLSDQAKAASLLQESHKRNQAVLAKVDQRWVEGCMTATLPYVDSHGGSFFGVKPSFASEQICAALSTQPEVKADLKKNERLHFKGCLSGIAMGMHVAEKDLSFEKRRQTLFEYCSGFQTRD